MFSSPDSCPHGEKRAWRAMLERFACPKLLEVIDLTAFVVDQHRHIEAGALDRLETHLRNSSICP